MDHFIKLARRGKPNTGASGGEMQARRLAICIIKNSIGLDDEAIQGAVEFLLRAHLAPQAAKTLVDYDA